MDWQPYVYGVVTDGSEIQDFFRSQLQPCNMTWQCSSTTLMSLIVLFSPDGHVSWNPVENTGSVSPDGHVSWNPVENTGSVSPEGPVQPAMDGWY